MMANASHWGPIIELICARQDLIPRTMQSGEPGTFPTFVVNQTHVVKLFGPLFDGLRSWLTELEVAAMFEDVALDVPVPVVIGAGVLSDVPAWRFIVSSFINGTSIARMRNRMEPRQLARVAYQLGPFLRSVHEVRMRADRTDRWSWDGWISFVNGQRRGLFERHSEWRCLPKHLVRQADDYVAKYHVDVRASPALLHADLNEDHVLGRLGTDGVWQISGLIDWGDARAGDRFYDLPALHLGLFHGDTALLAAFLESYGWPAIRSTDFVRRAMAMVLLHEFNVLEHVVISPEIESLDQLAAALWQV